MKSKVVLENDVQVTSSSPDDPRLRKRWGYVAARPSEYLIHFRNGNLNEKTSGQGGSCFKRLRDTIFIIPTSLKEIIFQANQLTNDNVDVRIRGMAVYRISEPLKIYKLLNFSNRQRAEEKLAHMIGDMCRSNSKWLVANMKVDECIRKRKEEIGDALKEEASRVITSSETGWGVEIVTIDIQDIYIQDEEIFNAMQMMFKTRQLRDSKLAQMETERTLETKAQETEREIAEHRKETELNKTRIEAEIQNRKIEEEKKLGIIKLGNERELAEHQKITELEKTRNEAVIKDEKIRLSKQNEAEQFDLDRFRVEQNEEIIRYKFDKEIERERQKAEFDLEKTEKETEAERLINDETIRTMEEKTRVENSFTSISLEKIFIEKAMPAIAEVMAKSMSEVKINMFQHGENMKTPFSFMLAEMMNVLKEIATPILNQNRIEKTESETDKQDLTSAQEGENKVIEQSDIKEED